MKWYEHINGTWAVTIFFLIALIVVVMDVTIAFDTNAQTKDVPPYEIGRVEGSIVFKQVYQGCELFIVRDGGGSINAANAVAIATGRGCK